MNNKKKQLLYKKILDEQLKNKTDKKEYKKPIIPLVPDPNIKTIDLTEHAKRMHNTKMVGHKNINPFGRHDFSFSDFDYDPNKPRFGKIEKKKDPNLPKFGKIDPKYKKDTKQNIEDLQEARETFKEIVNKQFENMAEEIKNNIKNVIIPEIKKDEDEDEELDVSEPFKDEDFMTDEEIAQKKEIEHSKNRVKILVNNIVESLLNYRSATNEPETKNMREQIMYVYNILLRRNGVNILKMMMNKNISPNRILANLWSYYNSKVQKRGGEPIKINDFLLFFFEYSTYKITDEEIKYIEIIMQKKNNCEKIENFLNILLDKPVSKIICHTIIRANYNRLDYNEAIDKRDRIYLLYYSYLMKEQKIQEDNKKNKKKYNDYYNFMIKIKDKYGMTGRQTKVFSKHDDVRKAYRENIIKQKLGHLKNYSESDKLNVRNEIIKDFDKLDEAYNYINFEYKEINEDPEYKKQTEIITKYFLNEIIILNDILELLYKYMFIDKIGDVCDMRIIDFLLSEYPDNSQIYKYFE
jgi:hypothetical protein